MRQNKLTFILGGPLTISRIVHLRKLLTILEGSFTDLAVIHEGPHGILAINRTEVFATGLSQPDPSSVIPLRIYNYWMQELRKFKLVLEHVAPGDIVMFIGIYQPLSLVATRMRGGFPIHFCGGFDTLRTSNRNRLLDEAYLALRWTIQLTLLRLSRRLIFETPSVKSSFNMDKFQTKSSRYMSLYVNESFRSVTPLRLRKFDIGYVGVLSEEKGIIELLKSLPIIISRRRVKVVLLGDGHLRAFVQRYLEENKLQDSTQIVYHADYEDMPNWFNDMKLLVVPSQSEGLPNVIIEAMACGTPVLTTKVGGVTDIIMDGMTGFFLHSRKPKHIAYQVVRLLRQLSILNAVSIQAQKEANPRFSLPVVQKNWESILKDISNEQILEGT